MIPRDALYVGLLTLRVGIPFRAMDLLSLAGSAAAGELAARVAAQIAGFRARNDETIASVRQVEDILTRYQLPNTDKPRTFEDFVRWASGASKAAAGAVTYESPASAALLVGGFFSDIAAAATLGRLVLTLLEAAPSHAALLDQAATLARELRQAGDRLATSLRHPALPGSARAPLDAIVAAVRSTPAIDGSEPLAARQAGLRALLAEVDRRWPEVNAAF